MPISSSDLLQKFSVKTGAAGNSEAGSAAGSLGKYISTTQLTDNSLNNLFDDVSGEENAASEAEYRCIFLHNAHATLTAINSKVYLAGETAGGAGIAIGVDTTAASAIGSAGAQALEVADEDTAPVGVAFSSPTTLGTAITLGDIAPGQCRAIWIRRLAANTTPLANDGVILRTVVESL